MQRSLFPEQNGLARLRILYFPKSIVLCGCASYPGFCTTKPNGSCIDFGMYETFKHCELEVVARDQILSPPS